MSTRPTPKRWRIVLVPLTALLAMAVAISSSVRAAEEEQTLRFPSRVTTIDGKELNVAELATTSTVVVVTLKAHSCPVCQEQLLRLEQQADVLEDCGVEFIVLAPGPREQLAMIRTRTGFEHPFVEDRDLAIADSLGLRMSADEIMPAFLVLEPDLRVGSMQRGRGPGAFGDAALLRTLGCSEKLPI